MFDDTSVRATADCSDFHNFDDGMFGLGVFLVSIQFPVLFANLCDVVRGASHNDWKLFSWYEQRKIRMFRIADSSHDDEKMRKDDRVMIVKKGSQFGEKAKVVDPAYGEAKLLVQMERDDSKHIYAREELDKLLPSDLQLEAREQIVLGNIQVRYISDMMAQRYGARMGLDHCSRRLSTHELHMLREMFAKYDENNDGELDMDEVSKLMSGLYGVKIDTATLHEASGICCWSRSKWTQASSALSSRSVGSCDTSLKFLDVLHLYHDLRNGEPGAFTQMSFKQNDQLLERQTFSPKQMRDLHMLATIALGSCALFFTSAVFLTIRISQYSVHDSELGACGSCISAHFYALPSTCEISDMWRNVYYMLLLVLVIPALFVMALIW